MRTFKGNIIKITWLIFCWLCFFTAFGGKPLQRDSSLIQARYFDASAINKYKHDADFRYEVLKEPARSLWERFWQWFWTKVFKLLSTRQGRDTFKISLLLIALTILVLFILQLRKMHSAGMFSSSKGDKFGYSVSGDDIHAIDFDAEIANAEVQRNYRSAVRLLYLQSLKKLSDAGRINWQIDKTNISYVNELRGGSFYELFFNLTQQFEKNCYGNILVESDEYEEVKNRFQNLNSKISS